MTGDILEVGNYQLEEQKSPEGYLISSTPIKFRISSSTAYETLPDVIQYLREQGYTFDNFYSIMK